MSGWLQAYWKVFSQELPVAECDSTRSMDSDHILVKLADLDYDACFVPFRWVWASLVLDSHMVADC